MLKFFRWFLIILVILIFLPTIVGFLFVQFSPQFGKSPDELMQKSFESSPQFEKGIFVNSNPKRMQIDFVEGLQRWFAEDPSRNPMADIPTLKLDAKNLKSRPDSIAEITWFGHSTFLLQMQGKTILLDPMFSEVPAPHPWLAGNRYSKELPIEIEELPLIDAVFLSHDHYDHLDYESIQRLKDKTALFFVPLGLNSHLEFWGVPKENIEVMDWWDEIKWEDFTIACTPARHFSGRGFTDEAKTLWASWVISGKDEKVFFSGDSGYDDHFKAIGNKYGPFDLALLECGQYDLDWKYIHMMPEETAQAAVDLKAKWSMPIHWGAFTLALHAWEDPVIRMLAEAKKLNVNVTTPRIGERINMNSMSLPQKDWWSPFVIQQ